MLDSTATDARILAVDHMDAWIKHLGGSDGGRVIPVGWDCPTEWTSEMVNARDPAVARGVDLAHRVDDVARALVVESTFRADIQLEITRAMLLASIVDGMAAVLALVQSNGQSHAGTIARSMLEALGDLANLTAERGAEHYFARMEMTAEIYAKSNAEDVFALGGYPLLTKSVGADVLRGAGTRIDQLARRGIPKEPIPQQARLSAPGLPPAMRVIWKQISGDAHLDLWALRRRHLRHHEIVIGDTMTPAAMLDTLESATMAVFCAAPMIQQCASCVTINYPRYFTTIAKSHRELSAEALRFKEIQMRASGWNLQTGERWDGNV